MTTTKPERDAGGEEWIVVARLHRPHGLRGDVRVESFCPEILDFQDLMLDRRFLLRRPGQPDRTAAVSAIRPYQRGYLALLEGFDDRTAAESLRGGELCLPREELPELPEGWFWEIELEGLAVVDDRRGEIGRVAGLDQIAGRWSLVVRVAEGRSTHVPMTEPLVRSVEPDSSRIDVDLPNDWPGLDDEENEK